MGLFWDLIQQGQLYSQGNRTDSLESRIVRLETQLADTQRLLQALLDRLEKHFGSDFDGDGRVG